jgi:FMN reductase (NADPH)
MPGFKKQTFMKSVLFKHRSIRKFRPTPIPEEVLRECLEAASRASTCGNMQLYSLVVTRDETLRAGGSPRATSTSRW